MAKTDTKKKKHVRWEDRPPTLEIRGKNYFDELSKWDVGEEYELVLRVKMTRKEESTGSDMYIGCCGCEDEDCGEDHEANRKKRSAGFEVLDIKSNGKVSNSGSPEAQVASRYNKYIKQGLTPAQAMARAKKG